VEKMNKKTTIVIAIFMILLLTFIIWNKFYSPNQWGRCRTSEDCAPKYPRAGYYAVCEEGKCVDKPLVDDPKSCFEDEDCVPATCCHALEAMNKEVAPNCENVFCTTECVPGTIDCGQGEIKCVGGVCEVVLSEETPT
jgi:hypothetical protein